MTALQNSAERQILILLLFMKDPAKSLPGFRPAALQRVEILPVLSNLNARNIPLQGRRNMPTIVTSDCYNEVKYCVK